MDAKASRGWAVIAPSGEIEVATVCATRRAAVVNWLHVPGREFIRANATDDFIDGLWADYASVEPGLRVAEVSIIEIRG